MERQIAVEDLAILEVQLEMDGRRAIGTGKDVAQSNVGDGICFELLAHPTHPFATIAMRVVVDLLRWLVLPASGADAVAVVIGVTENLE